MAIIFTGTGGWAERFGALNRILLDLDAHRGGTATSRVASGGNIDTRLDAYLALLSETVAHQYVIGSLYDDMKSWQDSASKTFAQKIIDQMRTLTIEMAHSDSALPAKTVAAAIRRFIATAGSNDVDATAISVGTQTTVAATGTPSIVVSAKSPLNGLDLQYVPSDTFRFRVTSDNYSGVTDANEEVFTVTGATKVTDATHHTWPGGGGVNGLRITVIDGRQDYADGQGNYLTNSDFNTFTVANLPDNWTRTAGTLGTHILSEASVVYEGAKALKIAGDGVVTTPALYQVIPAAVLDAYDVLSFNVWMKDTGAGLLAGVLTFSLVDGADAVITDALGTANTLSVAFSDTSGTYAKFGATFRLPSVVPSEVRLRIKATTDMTSGEGMYVDLMSLGAATELYPRGPWVGIHTGATQLVKGDEFTVALTTTWGTFQKALQRVFDMRGLNESFPADTGGTETIDDALAE